MRTRLKAIKLDPELAQKYLDLNTYAGQRPVREAKVKRLIDKITSGLFLTARIAVAKKGKTEVLVNGQHQLAAIIRTKVTVDCSLEEFFLAQGEGDLVIAKLFAQYDTEGQRSMTDVVGYHLQAYGLDSEISRSVGARIAGGLAWIVQMRDGANRLTLDKEQRAEMLRDNKRAALFVNNLAGMTRHISRAPVIAAMIETFRKDADDAEVFWTAVRDGEMLRRDDPVYHLRNFLLSSVVTSYADRREAFCKCLHAWNAYRAKRRIQNLRWQSDAPVPVVK